MENKEKKEDDSSSDTSSFKDSNEGESVIKNMDLKGI